MEHMEIGERDSGVWLKYDQVWTTELETSSYIIDSEEVWIS